jgi:hypothetical protein
MARFTITGRTFGWWPGGSRPNLSQYQYTIIELAIRLKAFLVHESKSSTIFRPCSFPFQRGFAHRLIATDKHRYHCSGHAEVNARIYWQFSSYSDSNKIIVYITEDSKGTKMFSLEMVQVQNNAHRFHVSALSAYTMTYPLVLFFLMELSWYLLNWRLNSNDTCKLLTDVHVSPCKKEGRCTCKCHRSEGSFMQPKATSVIVHESVDVHF